MSYLQSLLSGASNFGNLAAIAVIVLGTLLGVFVGVVPGLGGIVMLVVLLPFLYHINPVIGLALLLAAHSAIYYAGSTTAILMNTPGAPESAATCFDGYAMTRKGLVGRALGISAAATSYGGVLGAIAVLATIPIMVPLITIFHPPEFFLLTILAVVLIGQLQSGSPTKGILSGLFGFLLSFVGAAASTGSLRYTMHLLGLYNGINIVAAAIGLFAISQMFFMFASQRAIVDQGEIDLNRRVVWGNVGNGIRDLMANKWLATKSALIGLISGIVPGIGATAANFLSYGIAMRSSKHPELYGTGIPEGIIAPEGSSISKEAGALIPTVALGIPNGPAMAILLAAFAIMGLPTGPAMVTQHLPLVFWMALVIGVGSILASVLGLGLAPVLARITVIPGRVLVPFVLVLATIGVYATTSLFLQIVVMMLMGVVGLLMRRYGYSLPAVIVGLVLGSIAENNLVLTNQLYSWRFIESPLSDFLILAIIAVVGFGIRRNRRLRRGSTGTARTAGAQVDGRAISISKGEILLDLAWVAGSVFYTIVGSHYPSPADLAPMYLGGATALVGTLQLIGAFVPKLRYVTHGGGRMPKAGDFGTSAEDSGVPVAGGNESEAHTDAAPGVDTSGSVSEVDTKVREGLTGVSRLESAGQDLLESVGEDVAVSTNGKELTIGVLLAAVLVGAIYLIGFQIATPLWTFGYFVGVRRWKIHLALLAAVAVALVFFLISQILTSVLFVHGIL